MADLPVRVGVGTRKSTSARSRPVKDAELEKLAEDWKPYDGEPVEISVWMYPQDERSLKAYKKAFEKKYSNIKLKYVIYPEDKLRDQDQRRAAGPQPS